MDKNELLIIADLEEGTLSIEEVCEICHVSPQFVHELIAYEIVVPVPDKKAFNMRQAARLKAALRLQRDLDMNLASVAIVLDMLDELNELRARTALLQKHLLK